MRNRNFRTVWLLLAVAGTTCTLAACSVDWNRNIYEQVRTNSQNQSMGNVPAARLPDYDHYNRDRESGGSAPGDSSDRSASGQDGH